MAISWSLETTGGSSTAFPITTVTFDYLSALTVDLCAQWVAPPPDPPANIPGGRFVLLYGIAYATGQWEGVTSNRDMQISIGTNAPVYDDILLATNLTQLRWQDDSYAFSFFGNKSAIILPDQSPVVRVRQSLNGPTLAHISVYLWGFVVG